jgi:hypothetical protein
MTRVEFPYEVQVEKRPRLQLSSIGLGVFVLLLTYFVCYYLCFFAFSDLMACRVFSNAEGSFQFMDWYLGLGECPSIHQPGCSGRSYC